MKEATHVAISALLKTWKVPGCAIATTTASGSKTVFTYGLASLAPARMVSAKTAFHLFSGTKLYTAAAVMLLSERGAIALDEPIGTYLPDLPLRHPVTVRALLSHDSGLPDTLRAFLSIHDSSSASPSTAEALERYGLDRGGPAGTGASYKNVNYAILGELVTQISGMPYELFVQENLLGPLGADLAFRFTSKPGGDTAVGYMSRWSPMRIPLWFLVPRWVYGSATGSHLALNDFTLDTAAIGGLVGSVEAFLPMLREMLSPGGGVLSAETKREMLSLHSRGAAGIVSTVGVGVGWKMGRTEDITIWNHEGGGPGFCSETRLYPDDDIGIVILMNLSQSSGLSKVCHEICELLRRDLAGGGVRRR